MLVQIGQAFDHMLARVDRLILPRIVGCTARGDGLDQCISVRMAEPCNRIACGNDIRNVGTGFVERAGLDDAVFRRLEGVIEPAG